MYTPPTKDQILALDPLPNGEDAGLNVQVGEWENNRATDIFGDEWYTITNKGRSYRFKVFKVKR